MDRTQGRVQQLAADGRSATPLHSPGETSPAPPPHDAAATGLSARIHNLHEIGLAYGEDAERAATDHAGNVIASMAGSADADGFAERVLRALTECPVLFDGERIHLAVSLAPKGEAPDWTGYPRVGRGDPALSESA